MIQGAKAVKSGKKFELRVEGIIRHAGYKTVKPKKYKAIWNNGTVKAFNEPDKQLTIGTKKVIIECKNQNVSGTADQKGGTELYNAAQKIKCDHYILVYGGTWWNAGRGKNLFISYQKMAADFARHPRTFLRAAKNLHVIRPGELPALLKGIENE
jgi:hypothetical protein